MAPIELTAPPEQTPSITHAIFDVVREHGPLTISDIWDHVKVHQHPRPRLSRLPPSGTLAQSNYTHARNLFDRMFPPTVDIDLWLSSSGCWSTRPDEQEAAEDYAVVDEERQKLRLICDRDGPHKQFLYTTWFTNPKNVPQMPKGELKAKATEKLSPSPSKQP
ncbi:hypothetical protein BAE44_0005725 [Dichanthelium oligosanthes]|uniref:Uncharacterized protein n=1 Tax=Dichanthelium oligosanthes TaxID=888268 RepID=A0A1E5W762_9POAL|nr:hypothetical protein BAE44_0005725 [Dichanthelium oligosanthes]